MRNQVKPILTFILGAVSGGFFTKLGEGAYNNFTSSPERSISSSMCRGSEMLTVAVNEFGQEMVVKDVSAQYPISHVLSLKNDGSEVLDDYDIGLSLFPKSLDTENRSVFQLGSGFITSR